MSNNVKFIHNKAPNNNGGAFYLQNSIIKCSECYLKYNVSGEMGNCFYTDDYSTVKQDYSNVFNETSISTYQNRNKQVKRKFDI